MTKIKEYLTKHKIKVRYLITESGYHPTHISRIINGKKQATTKLIKLSRMALQKKLDKKFQELEKREKELKCEQLELDEALEELCHP